MSTGNARSAQFTGIFERSHLYGRGRFLIGAGLGPALRVVTSTGIVARGLGLPRRQVLLHARLGGHLTPTSGRMVSQQSLPKP